MEQTPENTNSLISDSVKSRNWIGLIAILIPFIIQYAEPAIDHMLGRDTEQLEIMREQIDARFAKMDSSVKEGNEFIEFVNNEMVEFKTSFETSKKSWQSRPFSIGLKAKQGTDSLWYRAMDGKTYNAAFDVFHMWWFYIDPNDWQNTRKAAYFEIPWDEFTEKQTKMEELIFYYDYLKQQEQLR